MSGAERETVRCHLSRTGRSVPPRLRRSLACLAIVFATGMTPAHGDETEQAYLVWGQGRPQEAVEVLHRVAEREGRWDRWYDLALAACEVGDRGHAVAWLLEAHRRAPAAPQPLAALRGLDAQIPKTWCERLGPLAALAAGWWALPLLGLGGIALGWAAAGHAWRRPALAVGLSVCGLLAPGMVAIRHDAATNLVAVVRDTFLLDATSRPVLPVAAGTLAERGQQLPWNERHFIRLPGGDSGWIPASDLDAR